MTETCRTGSGGPTRAFDVTFSGDGSGAVLPSSRTEVLPVLYSSFHDSGGQGRWCGRVLVRTPVSGLELEHAPRGACSRTAGTRNHWTGGKLDSYDGDLPPAAVNLTVCYGYLFPKPLDRQGGAGLAWTLDLVSGRLLRFRPRGRNLVPPRLEGASR